MKRKGKQGPKRMPEAVALVDRDQAGDIILHHLHTTLPGALWKDVRAMAKAEDRTVTSLIRRALLRYLEGGSHE